MSISSRQPFCAWPQDVPNICGVKESSGNLQQIAELIHLVPQDFMVLAGDDVMASACDCRWVERGLVSVASNEIPG